MTAATTTLVVCGAHLRGQPLNPFLVGLGAVFSGTGRTAPSYRMYALPATSTAPPRPGLVRQARGGGSIDVERYLLPVAALGPLLLTVRPPLAIGHLLLEDGSEELGFVCEGHVAGTEDDITPFGSWRSYLEAPAAADDGLVSEVGG